MFLNRDFCMEKLWAREVTIFPEKITSFDILLKIQSATNKLTKSGIFLLRKIHEIRMLSMNIVNNHICWYLLSIDNIVYARVYMRLPRKWPLCLEAFVQSEIEANFHVIEKQISWVLIII